MEDCFICRDYSERWKVLPCQHKLCYACFIRLDKNSCPFCRAEFKYTQIELKDRIKEGINYKHLQSSSQLITPDEFNERQTHNSSRYINNNETNNLSNRIRRRNNNIIEHNIPFSRINRNRIRNRRKNLSKDEILERRNITKKRIKRKWMKKDARYRKMNWWDISVN